MSRWGRLLLADLKSLVKQLFIREERMMAYEFGPRILPCGWRGGIHYNPAQRMFQPSPCLCFSQSCQISISFLGPELKPIYVFLYILFYMLLRQGHFSWGFRTLPWWERSDLVWCQQHVGPWSRRGTLMLKDFGTSPVQPWPHLWEMVALAKSKRWLQ